VFVVWHHLGIQDYYKKSGGKKSGQKKWTGTLEKGFNVVMDEV